MRVWLAMWLGLVPLACQAAHTHVRLLLGSEEVRPGDTILAGVHLQMDKGWHTYWRNSGGAGTPTTIDWELPAGVTAEPIQWPPPIKLPEQELTTYVYENQVILLVPLKIGNALPKGPLELKAKVSWLECASNCVPGDSQVQARVVVGSETKNSKDLALLESWQKKLPLSGETLGAQARWEGLAKRDLRSFSVEWPSAEPDAAVDFFPDSNEKYEVQPQTAKIAGGAGKLKLRGEVKQLAEGWPTHISGLLIEGAKGGQRAYDVDLALPDGPGQSVATGGSPGQIRQPLWVIFIEAFFGGLLLNIMPCVLPVIALKILGFVNEARNEPRRVRTLGLIYTAGVLASFLVLALIVLGLQAAGKAAGWGFQFGNPYFLIGMTVLVALIALNLFGVFEVTLSSGALGAATTLASKQGSAGAFFNGLLTTLLATSCTAPFLAPAVGFASVLTNPALTILILLTVGVGLAAPYLVLSYQPAWLKLLPKPGAWMEKFKIAMGFPMMAAAAWLCSLVAVHYGDRAWWMVMFLVLVSLAAWVFGEFVQRGRKRRGLALAICLALLVLGYGYALENKLEWREPIQASAGGTAARQVAPKGREWLPWSPEAVAEARASRHPVVVDFTAKWCPTCNTIVKPSFENAAVQKRLKELQAVTLVADYTLRPDYITEELKRFQRAGVPLVLVYPADPTKPPLVFDLVWPGTILDALKRTTEPMVARSVSESSTASTAHAK